MRSPLRRGVARRAASVRGRADRYILPCSDVLEVRQMLTAGPLGINVTGSLDFVDDIKDSLGWYQQGSAPLTFDAHGWPTSDARILVMDERVNQPWNGPDPSAVNPDIGGTYHLSFLGQATVATDWPNNFTVQNQVYNAQTNTTTADLVVQHNSTPTLLIDFSNTVNPASATGSGVSNVTLIQPGYAANTTQVFATQYLNALKPFGTIRYLNADAANNDGATTGSNGLLQPLQWSQRTLPSSALQTQPVGGTQGVAWEYMIELANATSTDMWINIPGPATDDYVTQLASLIKNGDTVNGVSYPGLNPNLKVYVEYSNEVWGGIYNPYSYNMEATKEEVAAGGSVLNNDGTTDLYTLAGRRYLERTMQITNIFRSVLGNDPTYSKVRPVLGWQETNWQYYQTTLPWFESTYGAPRNYFYGMGDAIYLGGSDYSSVDAVINSTIAAEASLAASTTDFATVANYYGLKLVSYEGGPSIASTASPAAEANALAASRDPRMEQIVDQMYTNWYADGGDVANFYDGPFDLISPANEWAMIELADEATPTNSAKFRGVSDLASSPTVAVTTGIGVSASGTTTLSLTGDSLGQSFTNPNTGQVNNWLLNASAAGTYSLTVTTYDTGGGTYQPARFAVYLGDQQLIGTFNVLGSATVNLGSLNLPARLSTLSIRTIAGGGGNGLTQIYPSSLTLTHTGNSSTAQYENVGDAGYSESGTWTKGSGYDEAAAGSGTSAADWTFNVTPGTYEVSAAWPASSGNTTAATYQVIQGAAIPLIPPSPPTVGDSGFEGAEVGSGSRWSFSYDPSGTPWVYSGMAGVSGNGSYFTSGNPSAPQGGQVAFVQSKGSFSQTTSGWSGGTYQLSFSAAQRGNYGGSKEDFKVLVDGVAVATFTPSGTSYQAYTTPVFAESAGSHKVTFQGLDTVGGDNTALVDNVSVALVTSTATSPSPAASVVDAGFEGATLNSSNSFWGIAYQPTGTAWTYSSLAGVTTNGSFYTSGNPSAPQGTKVGFLEDQGMIAQTISGWTGGTYQLSFSAAQRANFGTSKEDFNVLVDGVVVATFKPSSTSYQTYTTPAFAVTTGAHTITFAGLDKAGGDNVVFLDNLNLAQVTSTLGGGTVLGSSTVDQTQAPSGFLDAGLAWQDLGGPYTVTSGTTLTVQLGNSPLGKTDAKSIRIQRIS